MEFSILSRVKTAEDQEKLAEEIETLLSYFYKEKGGGLDYALKNKVRAWVAEALRDEISRGGVSVEDFLKELKQKLLTLEKMTVILAFEPSQAAVERIHWLAVKYIGYPILLDIAHDPSLMGGMIIIFKGNYRDFTLRRVVDEIFKKSQEEIMSLLSDKN